jgi:uncharacterized hydrophobic protein (TIGR00271 family)
MKHYPFLRKVLSYINLESDVDDFDKIHETIEKELNFKGTNLWILVFAIVVASVGLNINSTAVIIGAMLISPLMGPINGMGYSLATYDFLLFRKSIKNFSFAVIASLLASTLYFTLSPLSTAHSELLARTSPSIYDVLIALFGGLAGIIAISTKQKGNVIPGVAIATALMPPLCTAGYGLATWQLSYFFGALYLFTINTVFIALASIIITQILKFPIRAVIDSNQKKKVNQLISVIIVLVLFPSIYFGYNLVQKEKFLKNASNYIKEVSIVEGNYLLKNEIKPEKYTISLVYGGPTLTAAQKQKIELKAKIFPFKKVKIEFKQGFSFDEINKKNSEVENMKAELNRLSMVIQEKEKQLDSTKASIQFGRELLNEGRALFPQIDNCSYASTLSFNTSQSNPFSEKIVTFNIKGRKLSGSDKKKIEDWLNVRLKSRNVKIFYEN